MSGEELREAVCDGQLGEMKRLVSEGADINYVDADDGWPLLHWAVKENQPACLEFLLENGANRHVVDGSGNTALHKAAYLGNRECLEVLLTHGALVNGRNQMNHTPMDMADLFGQKEIIEILSTHMRLAPQVE